MYALDGKTYRIPIKTLRGDVRLPDGRTGSRLRSWERRDFIPRQDDVLQERLYCIQWSRELKLDRSRPETYFAAPTEADHERERLVESIVANGLSKWQDEGLVPDMVIEPGEETSRLARERGWTHWHHLFNARQLLLFQQYRAALKTIEDEALRTALLVAQSKSYEWNSRLCRWATSSRHENQVNTFSSQALNTLFN